MFYTIGQNRGLNLGGQAKKYFVCKKNLKNNVLYVVDETHKNKFLSSKECELNQFNWINNKVPAKKKIDVRFRHRQKLIKAKIKAITKSKIRITYESTLSVTPGQFAVLYQGNICLGGGIVNKLFN
jgi:tRNA-specific 2-thiouridylase